jgi:hypothetical protein
MKKKKTTLEDMGMQQPMGGPPMPSGMGGMQQKMPMGGVGSIPKGKIPKTRPKGKK